MKYKNEYHVFMCFRHDLHIILDEIYALSPIGHETEFHSVLSIKDLPCPEKTHFLWGFSKVCIWVQDTLSTRTIFSPDILYRHMSSPDILYPNIWSPYILRSSLILSPYILQSNILSQDFFLSNIMCITF